MLLRAFTVSLGNHLWFHPYLRVTLHFFFYYFLATFWHSCRHSCLVKHFTSTIGAGFAKKIFNSKIFDMFSVKKKFLTSALFWSMWSSSKTLKTAMNFAAILSDSTGPCRSTLYYIHIILHTSSQAIYQLYNLLKLPWHIKYPRKRKLSVLGWKLKKKTFTVLQTCCRKAYRPKSHPKTRLHSRAAGQFPGDQISCPAYQ